MNFYWFMLAVLAVWRVTHLLNAEDGPAGALVRLRLLAGNGFWGDLLDCFYCLSLWVAAPPAVLIGEDWKEKLLLWPALSGGSVLLERISARERRQIEDPYVLLREEEAAVGRRRD